MVKVQLVPRTISAMHGGENLASASLTCQAGVSWQVDTEGNLQVYDKEAKPVLIVARGEWQSAASEIIDKPTIRT